MELVLENLRKTYPNGTHALRGVSLRAGAGMFGLLGPNGAGKSTLMRTLATLQDADEGTATLRSPDGTIDILRDKERLRAVLGYLPQEFGVYPRATARELLDHLARLKGIADRRARDRAVDELLERTNLGAHAKARLGGFSGGMKRRFGIAQALLGGPKLLIVDEPTAGLDPDERARFHNLLAEVSRETVVLLSTHIVEDVTELCQHFAILADGAVRLHTTPRAALETLDGHVFEATSEEARAYAPPGATTLSTRLVGGVPHVRVWSETPLGPPYRTTPPELSDVYFHCLRTQRPEAP